VAAGLESFRSALDESLVGDELYLGDELLVDRELVLEEGPPPRGYLPAPVEEDEESSGPPTSRGLGPLGIESPSIGAPDVDSGIASPEAGTQPPSSRLEPRATAQTGTRGTGDAAPREREGTGSWTRRRLGRRYRAFDSGVFTQARRQTAKR
jgi:hypothetical protein